VRTPACVRKMIIDKAICQSAMYAPANIKGKILLKMASVLWHVVRHWVM